MKKILIFLGVLLLIVNIEISANNGIVLVTKIENNKRIVVPMTLEIDGDLKLFSVQVSESALIQVNETDFREIVRNTRKEYYLGHGFEVEIIASGNFKKVAKRYFSGMPDLAKRIGKRGFRYENLPSMVLYHNKMKVKGKPLTKMDTKHWTTLN